MWCAFSGVTSFHSLWRIGCLAKDFTWPPQKWRQAWQERL